MASFCSQVEGGVSKLLPEVKHILRGASRPIAATERPSPCLSDVGLPPGLREEGDYGGAVTGSRRMQRGPAHLQGQK